MIDISEVNVYVPKPSEFKAVFWKGNNIQEVKKLLGGSFLSVTTERRLGGESFVRFQCSGYAPITVATGMFIVQRMDGSFSPMTKEEFSKRFQPKE